MKRSVVFRGAPGVGRRPAAALCLAAVLLEAVLIATAIGGACLAAGGSGDRAAEEAAGGPFSGTSLAGWRTLGGGAVSDMLDDQGAGWEVADGLLHLVPSRRGPDGRRGANFTIVTAEEYGDFSLAFEWRIVSGGNNGIKYRVRNYGGHVLGCEYQILDDGGGRAAPDSPTSCGSLYGLFAPPADKTLAPPGDWNAGRIVVRGDRLEHWLNGRLVVAATVGDADWERRVADSKFAEWEGFGRNRRGRLMLTDHGTETWFRRFVFEPADE